MTLLAGIGYLFIVLPLPADIFNKVGRDIILPSLPLSINVAD